MRFLLRTKSNQVIRKVWKFEIYCFPSPVMKNLCLLFAHFLITIAKLLRPWRRQDTGCRES